MSLTTGLPRVEPITRRDLSVGVAVLLAEGLIVAGYFGGTAAAVTNVRYVVYPFVWINLGLLALAKVRLPRASRRHRRLAAVVAVGYFLFLSWIAGLVSLSPLELLGLAAHSHAHSHIQGWQLTMSAPGWGPRIGYATTGFQAYFVPYRVAGYVGLSYLLYATVLGASSVALSGVLGVASCISCTFPLVAPLVGGFLGAGVTAVITGYSLDVSTLAFVLAFGLLAWGATAGGAGTGGRAEPG